METQLPRYFWLLCSCGRYEYVPSGDTFGGEGWMDRSIARCMSIHGCVRPISLALPGDSSNQRASHGFLNSACQHSALTTIIVEREGCFNLRQPRNNDLRTARNLWVACVTLNQSFVTRAQILHAHEAVRSV